ncbi:MAG: hypothetical protein HYU66_26880, partial [Armatimonadetes bacterium]|nr:hypothetical protein [Armatimonadota bacterium]
TTPALPAFQYPFEVRLDCSEAPDLAAWAAQIPDLLERWWPVMAEMLQSEGFRAPRSVNLALKKMPGIAYTSDGIYCSDKWLRDHPDDLGCLIHELVHWQQRYNGGEFWVTEGIADWFRYFIFEPEKGRFHHLNADKVDYRHGYGEAGAFLDWIERTKGGEFIRRLNESMRRRRYNDGVFKELAGDDLPTLWQGFRDSLK